MNKKETIKKIADDISRSLLEEGFDILRYDSYSSNSVYLKIDFGVCHTIRISDHPGKKHLHYRYNVLLREDPFGGNSGTAASCLQSKRSGLSD